MDAVFCKNGHSYDPEKYSTCPYCGVQVEIDATRPHAGGGTGELNATSPGPSAARPGETRAENEQPQGRPGADGETVHIWKKRLGGIDPVVGWLVCIEGPDRGRDYRIHTERNFIGRAPTMDIAITGDPAISRDNHAVLSYNPRRHTFRLAPGDSRGIVYLNDEEVMGAIELQPYDRIELGETKLLFVPFCGERFVWSADQGDGKGQ
jgi:hypothetical protein